MRFGLLCSSQAGGDDLPPETGQGFRDYFGFNARAERLGFHSSFLVEHHFSGCNHVSATLMLLTALTMRTTTMRLGPALMVLLWPETEEVAH
jgi:alkanesulfonate monooxygenase SsuD/methylene tetrahydromethanopterin reductase-like flavin-dependent oxidoreductase (luciferase family)